LRVDASLLPDANGVNCRIKRSDRSHCFRWERIPRDPDGRIADDVRDVADVAIEILAPGQRNNQLELRCASFVDQGPGAALLVNPYRQVVRRFRPGAIPIDCHRGDVIDLGASCRN
jgi:hypothetical protein